MLNNNRKSKYLCDHMCLNVVNCNAEYSDTSANQDNSFRNHIR